MLHAVNAYRVRTAVCGGLAIGKARVLYMQINICNLHGLPVALFVVLL